MTRMMQHNARFQIDPSRLVITRDRNQIQYVLRNSNQIRFNQILFSRIRVKFYKIRFIHCTREVIDPDWLVLNFRMATGSCRIRNVLFIVKNRILNK